jgi:cathepsin B
MSRESKSKSPERSPETEEMREKAREAITRRTRKPKPFYEKYAYHIVIGVFILIVLYSLINSLWRTGPNIQTTLVNDEALITLRNSGDSTFKVAAMPAFQDYKLSDAKLLFNNQATNKQQLYKCSSGDKASIISESYNFREAHPECVRPIINQGN